MSKLLLEPTKEGKEEKLVGSSFRKDGFTGTSDDYQPHEGGW